MQLTWTVIGGTVIVSFGLIGGLFVWPFAADLGLRISTICIEADGYTLMGTFALRAFALWAFVAIAAPFTGSGSLHVL